MLNFSLLRPCLLFLPLLFSNIFSQSTPLNLGIKKGIYSGTFDPPTKAHNEIIRNTIKTLELDKLYIFVNKNNNKDCKCSSKERVEMLEAMLKDISDKVVIIAQSSERKSDDYIMIKRILNEELVLITGEDSYKRRLLILPQYRYKIDSICIIPRGPKDINLELEPIAFYLPLETDLSTVSSTKVRQQLANKSYTNIDLTPEVLSYIIEKHLYNAENKDEKKSCYVEKYYTYIGKLYAPCPPPDFDPLSSEDSWQEKFHKWFSEKNDIITKFNEFSGTQKEESHV